MDRDRLASRALRVVGVSSAICGVIGLAFNAVTLSADYSSYIPNLKDQVTPAQFYRALYVMSGICMVFYAALIVIGAQLIRSNSGWAKGLLGVVALEVIYYLAVGIMWKSPQYGTSVAAATGFSIGGLSVQAFVLFPIWGPWIALWAHRRQTNAL